MLALRIFLIRFKHFFQDYKAMNFISHVRNQYRTTNLCPTQSYAFFKNSSKNRDFTRLLPELDHILYNCILYYVVWVRQKNEIM